MAQQDIIIGVQDDGTGDTSFDAFTKVQNNFTELYNTSTALAPLSKLVAIFEESDLPDAVAGQRNLDSGKTYVFYNNVTTTDQLVPGAGTEITAIGRNIVLTYTGTSVFIPSNDNDFAITNITIAASSVGAKVLSLSTTSLKVCRVINCSFQCYTFADFSGVDWVVLMDNVGILSLQSTAFTCSGTCRSFNIDTMGAIPTTGIIFDLGSCVFDSLVIDKVVYNLAAGTNFISGLANNGNISAAGRGVVVNCQGNNTGGTDLVGVDPGDARWKFENNTPIADTRNDFLVSFDAAATTTINTAGTYELINGTYVEDHANGFTSTSGGRLTWDGVEDISLPVDLAVSLEPASGTNKDIAVKVAVNGVVQGPALPSRVDSGNPQNINIPWQGMISSGDYVEAYVANITDTTNIQVNALIFRGN